MRTGQTHLPFIFPTPIEQHPCYWPSAKRLSHRCYITRGQLMHCERCGVELDENKKEVDHALS